MGEEKSRSLTRTEFEAVMKWASGLAVSDPYDGQSTLDEAEVFRITSEVGLPHKHVRRALAEMRSDENPNGITDRWFGAPQVWGSRVVQASQEDLRRTLDEFLVAGNLLEAVRQGTDLLLYRPAVDWILHFARAGASLSRRAHWASAKEIEIHLEEVDAQSTLIEIRVEPDIRGSYTVGAGLTGLGAGGWYGLRRWGAIRGCVGPSSGGGVRRPVGRRDCGCHGEGYRSLFHESTGGGSARTGGGARSVGAG